MRWYFHRARAKRFNIVLNELRTIFIQNKGWDLLMELTVLPKDNLSLDEERLIYHFDKLSKVLDVDQKKPSKKYVRFSKSLRTLVSIFQTFENKAPWHERLHHIVHEFCVTKYYRTHFYSYGKELLQDLFSSLTFSDSPENLGDHFKNYNFLEEAYLIEQSGPAIFLERDLRRLNEGYIKTKFDSHRYNIPFLLYTLAFFRSGSLTKIKMIRMGSPTYQSWFKKPYVVDEFKGFLKHLGSKNKNHLYINKQKTWGEEGERSDQIVALEEEFTNFFCVCIPSDGDFYYQKGVFKDLEEMQKFKRLFHHLLLGKINIGYYHIPKQWREDPSFQKGLEEVLDDVHTLYFDTAATLSNEDRRVYIDICYTHLIIFIMKHCPIDSMNITCKDGIDRAGCEQIKLLYYFHVALGIEEEEEAKNERQFTIHFPVYLAKTRAIVPERREFLNQVFKAVSPQIRKQIRERHSIDPLLYAKPHFVRRKEIEFNS